MKSWRAVLAAAFLMSGLAPGAALAQGALQQLGAFVPGQIPMYVRGGLLATGGAPAAGQPPANQNNPGTLPSGIAIVNPAQGLALYSGYASAAYSGFKLGFDGAGNAKMTIERVGGGANPTFTVSIAGVDYPFPGTGGGNIVGPSSTTSGNLPVWNNAAGTLLGDSGVPLADARALGMVADGATDNWAALAAIFARTDAMQVHLGPGIYRLSCGHYFNAASAISLVGDGRGVTTLKFDPNCAVAAAPGGVLQWTGKPGASLRNLTIDLNGATATTNQNILFFQNANFEVRGVEIKGAAAPHMLLLVASATTGTTIADYRIEDNLLSFPAGSTTQNQCVATTTLGGLGTITRGIVTGNICVNSGMQLDGTRNLIANNDISGWNFGTGIYTPPVNTDGFNVIIGNNLHDSGLAHDTNAVPAGGIENNSHKSLVVGNNCTNLGGACLVNFGQHTLIANNTAVDVALVTSPVHASCEDAAFVTPLSAPNLYGAYSTYIGNRARNSGLNNSMKYGYCESGAGGYAPGIKFIANDFVGATSAYSHSNTSNSLIDWTLIARQPGANNIASITFTGLDTASYRSWKLECNGIGPVAAATMQIRVGEGATPTWQTAASYQYTGAKSLVGGGGLAQFNSTTATGILLGDNQWALSTMNTFTAEFGDLGAVDTKPVRFAASGIANGSGLQDVRGSGAWGGGTNPITAIQISAVGQNLTVNNGCLLWGHP